MVFQQGYSAVLCCNVLVGTIGILGSVCESAVWTILYFEIKKASQRFECPSQRNSTLNFITDRPLARPCVKIRNATLLLPPYCATNTRTNSLSQPGLLRHPVLQRGLLRDPGAAGETSEVDRRRTGRTFYTEAHHVRVPVLPLAALPHHVHP